MAARTTKVKLSESWKDSMRVAMLMNQLRNHADGKIELSVTQLKAIDMILMRTVPSLSAVEQTTINPDDALTEGQIILKFQALISAFPDLREKLLAEPVRVAPGVPNTEPETVTH